MQHQCIVKYNDWFIFDIFSFIAMSTSITGGPPKPRYRVCCGIFYLPLLSSSIRLEFDVVEVFFAVLEASGVCLVPMVVFIEVSLISLVFLSSLDILWSEGLALLDLLSEVLSLFTGLKLEEDGDWPMMEVPEVEDWAAVELAHAPVDTNKISYEIVTLQKG